MTNSHLPSALADLFRELVDGAPPGGGAYMLNSGDAGLMRSLDALTAAQASSSVHEGASIAAHVTHVTYGLALMNQWAREGGNPFANAKWDEAWKVRAVGDDDWQAIREGLAREVVLWKEILATPRETNPIELRGIISSIAHLAYHFGAIRQIAAAARGPREGTFAPT